jgi:phage-related protein
VAVVVGEAAVRLRPETSTFKGEAEAEVNSSMPGVAAKAAGFFVAAFAAVKVGEFLKDAVTQASDLSESASKVNVVFGDAAGAVEGFAHTAALSMGISQQQALEATGTFGNLFRAMQIAPKTSADMSTGLVKLSGDLASFNNMDPTEVLQKLRSGLTGETEPLKDLGVNINQAALQQEALRLGLAKTTAEITPAAQAQAAYSLIMQQTTLAQGDFARTSGGLANQTRIMAAQFLDLKANVGAGLLPFINLGARGITGLLMPALLTGSSYLKDFGEAAGVALDDVQSYAAAAWSGVDRNIVAMDTGWQRLGFAAGNAANIVQGEWVTFTDAVKGGGEGMLATEPSITGFLSRFGTGLHLLAGNATASWMSIRTSASDALAPLGRQLAPTFDSIKASIGQAFAPEGITGSGSGLIGAAAGILNKLTPMITGVIGQIAPVLAQILPTIGNVVVQIVPIVSSVFSQIGPVISQIVPVIMQVSGIWREVFMGAFEALLPVIPTIVGVLGQLVSTLASALVPLLTTLAPVISQVATAFQTGLVAIIQALVPVIPPLVTAIGQVVTILAGAFMGVLQALLPVIPTIVDVVSQLATILAQGLGQALQTIIPILPQIAKLLGDVATMVAGALGSVLQALLPILPPLVSALMQIANVLIGALMGALQAIMPVIPLLLGVFLQLIQSALVPLLPILPLLANLLATIISAIAPLIPVIIQVVVLIIQLAVAAIMPLLPVILILANLITMLIGVLVPIIQVIVTIVGAFIGFAATIISVVVGFVSTVIGVWTGLISAVTSIFGAIFSVISGIWNGIFGFISGIVTKIAGFISGIFSGVGSAISGAFSGIGNAISDVFQGAVNVVKKVVNTIIGVINGAIDFINSKLIDTANKVPFVNIPHIPHIPTLHEGGVFTSNVPAGQGLALLRDNELVVTPEQRIIADDLLRALLDGRVPGRDGAPGAPGAAGQAVQVVNNVTQQPGEDGAVLAARVTQGVVWNLNAGITRRVGVAAEVSP